jgi:hypothetical protein
MKLSPTAGAVAAPFAIAPLMHRKSGRRLDPGCIYPYDLGLRPRYLLRGGDPEDGMSDELQELHEHAEHAHHNPSMAPVSLTMAVLAVFVAVVSLLGHRSHTEEVVLQAKSSDQWAYYQAKNIRQHEDELFADLSAAVASKDAAQLDQFREKSTQEAERYKKDKEEIQGEAKKLEGEVAMERRRADRYDLAEVFLEIGLVITSITLLSERRIFWHLGIFLAVVGVAVAVAGAMVH